MNIILSRKGFDSSTGGVASPIMPDGTLVSLPIPDPLAPLRYHQLLGQRPSIARLVGDLTKDTVTGSNRVHLDPDLVLSQQHRNNEWQPSFGQAGSALGHLDGCGVGKGDLFLFFGWFRAVEKHANRWRYMSGAPDLHILFGWLFVDEIWRFPEPVPAALRGHVHTERSFRGSNAVYRGADYWIYGQNRLPGAGNWARFDSRLKLTDGPRRSLWKLPAWFHPESRSSCLSYHQKRARWSKGSDCCRLDVAARGQEFVLNCDHYPEAPRWAADLISLATSKN